VGKNTCHVVGRRGQHWWDAACLRQHAPSLVVADDRPGAPAGHFFWAVDRGQVGQFLHGYRSAWLPASLLQPEQQPHLADALFASTRHWVMSRHFNKGVAGAPAEEVAAARDTAMHPAVLDACALAISAGSGPPAFPNIPDHTPDLAVARRNASAIGQAMDALQKVVPEAGSYVAESNFFQ